MHTGESRSLRRVLLLCLHLVLGWCSLAILQDRRLLPGGWVPLSVLFSYRCLWWTLSDREFFSGLLLVHVGDKLGIRLNVKRHRVVVVECCVHMLFENSIAWWTKQINGSDTHCVCGICLIFYTWLGTWWCSLLWRATDSMVVGSGWCVGVVHATDCRLMH